MEGMDALRVDVVVQRQVVTLAELKLTRLEQAKVDVLKIGAVVAESNVNTTFCPSSEKEADLSDGELGVKMRKLTIVTIDCDGT